MPEHFTNLAFEKKHFSENHKVVASDWSDRSSPETLVLFDVDGTLSPSRKTADPEMLNLLAELKKKVVIGFVGGSDLSKQKEQLGEEAVNSLFDFGFSENGATAYRKGKLIANDSFIGYLGEENYKKLIKFILHYLADLEIPIKRGTFVEFRNGMINVSPIGRNCTYQERLQFEEFDKINHVREKMVSELAEKFESMGLKFSIGGQISIDIFPQGWDKTFCLKHLSKEGFKNIYFFGDKTEKGGNDYEIFNDPRIKGFMVKSPEDTFEKIRSLFHI